MGLTQQQLVLLAENCPEFASVSLAQGYGVSLANVSGRENPRCDNCINWAQGDCDIFKASINNSGETSVNG